MKLHPDVSHSNGSFACFAIPRLSAAMTTPSLNFAASTEVPVTIGLCVCWFGPVVWKCEGSYAPYTSSLGYDALVLLLFEAGGRHTRPHACGRWFILMVVTEA
jgi:hypothetical protein